MLCLVTSGEVFASAGDRAQGFIHCVDLCKAQNCGADSTYALPLVLRLTRWTCPDDCKYTCMHEVTDKDLFAGRAVEQYYGKWPFWRFLGMQEPASVAFSVLNLLAHWRGSNKLRASLPEDHPMKTYYMRWAWVSINAWVWSSVFHTRDLPLTEKLDYFSAALAILYGFYFTSIRLFHLYPPPKPSKLTLTNRPDKSYSRQILTTICSVAFFCHISYLTLLPRFDYTYNMAFNLIVGLSHNFMWTLYSLPASLSLFRRFPSQPKKYRPRFVTQAAYFVFSTTAVTALELLDFPPLLGVLDAHALWHLSTAPIALMWYEFLSEDSLDPSWRYQRL
ncbi:Per1-like protein [Crepidotus variabilis]|uniref:Post-GPI attachment to proteins factor 3 n=1 Tax=Crepidotus variabilis TaxID=179855 RepID=A0A9P6JV63_9AGAR|nr:Per1-like protein [Crepidotus variabilis]